MLVNCRLVSAISFAHETHCFEEFNKSIIEEERRRKYQQIKCMRCKERHCVDKQSELYKYEVFMISILLQLSCTSLILKSSVFHK